MSETRSKPLTREDLTAFQNALFNGDLAIVRRYIEAQRVLVRLRFDGLTALHIAVGTNNLELTKFLVAAGARFEPDREGRLPSTIAAECEASEDLCDFIVEAEEKALSARKRDIV